MAASAYSALVFLDYSGPKMFANHWLMMRLRLILWPCALLTTVVFFFSSCYIWAGAAVALVGKGDITGVSTGELDTGTELFTVEPPTCPAVGNGEGEL